MDLNANFRQDAYVLASLLSDKSCAKGSILKIAEIYNDIRCVEGNRALEAAIGCGRRLHLIFPGLEHVKEGDSNVDTEVLSALGKELSQAWSWVWKDSAEDDRIRALERLNEAAGQGIETN
jgi:salicylate hydroxylase